MRLEPMSGAPIMAESVDPSLRSDGRKIEVETGAREAVPD